MALISLEATDYDAFKIIEINIEFPFYIKDSLYYYKFINEFEGLSIHIPEYNPSGIILNIIPEYFQILEGGEVNREYSNGELFLSALNNEFNCVIIKEEEFYEKLELYEDFCNIINGLENDEDIESINNENFYETITKHRRGKKINNLLKNEY